MNLLRDQIETNSPVRLVEPKSLMPDSFGKKNRPELENLVEFGKGLRWCGAHSSQTSDEECRKPETDGLRDTSPTRPWRDTNEMDQELQHFLISRTEGEALEVVRGTEREPGLEQWRRLAALYDPLAAGRSLDDSHQILSPPKATKMEDLSHAIQALESLEQRHRERTGDQSKDMRLAILLSMCPTDLEKELTAHQHMFLDYAQMRAHRDSHQQSHSWPCSNDDGKFEGSNNDAKSDELVEGEDGELYCLEIWKKSKKHRKTCH